MDEHQAGQEEKLVQVRVATDSLDVIHRPRGSRTCFRCAVAWATMMGLLVVALMAGFILHYFMFTPSCSQGAPAESDTAKFNRTFKLIKSDEKGRYDIFTTDKAVTYLIYGWVRLSSVTSEDIVLSMHTRDKDTRDIQSKKSDKTEIFFFEKVKLVDGITISISFRPDFTDSSFHVYEL